MNFCFWGPREITGFVICLGRIILEITTHRVSGAFTRKITLFRSLLSTSIATQIHLFSEVVKGWWMVWPNGKWNMIHFHHRVACWLQLYMLAVWIVRIILRTKYNNFLALTRLPTYSLSYGRCSLIALFLNGRTLAVE